jgi:hypothetical protein
VFTIEAPRAAASPYAAPAQAAPSAPEMSTGDIRVGEGISRGFSVLHSNIGVFILIALCFIGISIGISIASQIPCLGILIALANGFLLQPALTCGFYRACLKQHDGLQAEVGDLFAEFTQWVDILLVSLLRTAIAMVVCLPGLVLLGISLAPVLVAAFQNQQPPTPNIPLLVTGIVVMVVCSVFAALAMMFMYPALVDRRAGCIDAMKTSWQLMTSNPIGAIGSVLLAGLFGLLGVLACCVGILYAMPAIQCMFAAIYRTATPVRAWTAMPAYAAAGWPYPGPPTQPPPASPPNPIPPPPS